MRSKKVSKKLKATLLVIDLLLLAAVAATGFFCYRMMEEEKTEPKLDYAYESAMLDQKDKNLDKQIEEQMALLAADLTSDAHLQEKQQIEDQMAQLSAEVTELTASRDTQIQLMADLQDPEKMKEMIEQVRTEYGQTVRQLEDMINAGESDYRICYLTFDDGPTYYTPDFLDRHRFGFFFIGSRFLNRSRSQHLVRIGNFFIHAAREHAYCQRNARGKRKSNLCRTHKQLSSAHRSFFTQ